MRMGVRYSLLAALLLLSISQHGEGSSSPTKEKTLLLRKFYSYYPFSYVLPEVHKNLPIGIDLKIESIEYKPTLLRIKAHADSFRTVEEVKKNLQDLPFVKEVKIKGLRSMPAEKGRSRVKFQLQIHLKNLPYALNS